MADLWLDGYERINLDDGLSYTGGPPKLVLHTMEGSIESCIQVFKADPGKASHTAISFERNRRVQFIPYNHSAKSLRNLPGGVQTNRDMAYQVEIEGFAADSPNWSDAKLRFIAQHIADVWKLTDRQGVGFPLVAYNWTTPRMSGPAYDIFTGICGHRHVPENDHTDPGLLDITKLLRFTREALGDTTPTTPEEEDDMPLPKQFVAFNPRTTEYAIFTEGSSERVQLPTPDLVKYWVKLIEYRGDWVEGFQTTARKQGVGEK